MSKEDKTMGVRRPDRNAHSTARADRSGKNHSTAKAVDRSTIKPYEAEGNENLRSRLDNREAVEGKTEWPDTFELDGKTYKNEGILSASSGEAIVFAVSHAGKKYALKVYYYDPAHRPNHEVLEKIKNLGGNGLLVNIVSHGLWRNPNSPALENDYELMDYCEGGSLDGVILNGDEMTLSEVAVRIASAIDFLAKHGIIHRDIKPSNFFYADKEKTQIVLADFGISVECPEGETVKIDQMRSPVYASPEFYTNVPGEAAEIGVESDYFSLGVSLLALWMGKDKLSANESQLLRSKHNET
ncbi:MAG: protein kinase, partial [Duncaniella sp.]|nr:protein kinase [Duncaniella sp.]